MIGHNSHTFCPVITNLGGLRFRELEWAMYFKIGPMIGNDVHQLLLKYEPRQPDGGAVIKDLKCVFGKATPLTP